MNPELVAYIRENRDRYTREAITRHLVGAGHAPEDVEAAWAAVEEEALPDSPPAGGVVEPEPGAAAVEVPVAARRSVWREPLFYATAIGFVIFYLGGSALLIAVASDSPGIFAAFSSLVPLIALVTGIVLVAINRARTVGWGLLAGIALLLLLGFIGVVIIAGICVALIVQAGNP